MKFDYSKTINEQLPTFEYYKDRYCSYELELINDRKEIERLNNIIKHTDSWIDRTIEIIKQQPSEDDTWILERLNSIKHCLKGSDKE